MRKWVVGLVITTFVALSIAVIAGAIPVITEPAEEETQTYEEFTTSSLVQEPIPARDERTENTSAADGDGVVLIDDSHGNRFDRASIQPLVEAITARGYDVRFYNGNLADENVSEATDDSAFAAAEAFVVIDPSNAYDHDELDTLETFVDEGGRLLILAEPNRIRVQATLFGATIQTEESQLTSLGNRFDLAFDTQYVHDQERNDGNYKHPLVTPPDEESLGSQTANRSTISRVAVYTAAEVESTDDGQPILVTSPTTRIRGSDVAESRPIAIRDDDVLAMGDASWLASDRYTVADNELLLRYIVSFLIGN